jgi:hypothetical protein
MFSTNFLSSALVVAWANCLSSITNRAGLYLSTGGRGEIGSPESSSVVKAGVGVCMRLCFGPFLKGLIRVNGSIDYLGFTIVLVRCLLNYLGAIDCLGSGVASRFS